MASLRMRFNPGDTDGARPTIEALVGRFQAQSDSEADLDLILGWKVAYADGRLDRWRVSDVEKFLLEWAPNKVSAPPSWVTTGVATVVEALSFLADEGLLSSDSDPCAKLAEHARSIADECERRMGDPEYFGMAKAMFASMGVDFEQELTQEDLNRLMKQFNELPFEQRKSVTDRGQPKRREEPVMMGPVVAPTGEQLRAAAEASPLIIGFQALSDFFAEPGRPLTATGNVKLADADALSPILGTETVEDEVGGTTFRRHSSSRMPDLNHWMWLAEEFGVIRKVKSRMVAVKAWRKRCVKDPFAEIDDVFQFLIAEGPIATYRWWMEVDKRVDQAALVLLAMPLRFDGSVSFSTMVDAVIEMARRAGMKAGYVTDDHDFEWRMVASDVDLLLKLYERLGLVIQSDVTHEKWHGINRRTGGSISLTPLGLREVISTAHLIGAEVQTITSPESMTAQELADLAGLGSDIDTAAWWELVTAWLDARGDRSESLIEMLGLLGGPSLLRAVYATPDAVHGELTPLMADIYEAQGASTTLGVIAGDWLLRAGMLSDEARNSDEFVRCDFGVYAIFAEATPEQAPRMWANDMSPQQQIAGVLTMSRLMPLGVETLLDSIGRYHDDKAVAKTARRELLKVRSRVANRR